MSPDDIRRAALAELTGYWTTALRKRSIWQQDVYVDLGTTVVARADLTIRTGGLVTKSEAIAHLAELGLPDDVLEGVRRRRLGAETEALTGLERQARADTVRRFVQHHIDRLAAVRSE
jgi:hypothetical protein